MGGVGGRTHPPTPIGRQAALDMQMSRITPAGARLNRQSIKCHPHLHKRLMNHPRRPGEGWRREEEEGGGGRRREEEEGGGGRGNWRVVQYRPRVNDLTMRAVPVAMDSRRPLTPHHLVSYSSTITRNEINEIMSRFTINRHLN